VSVVHYVADPTGCCWIAACGVNNQRPKPGTDDPEQVTCLRCLEHLTRPAKP
jgi:hypothetical protein